MRWSRVLLVLMLVTAAAQAADWPHVRGPEYDGRATAPGTFAAENIGLDLQFRVPLGSGYSGVAVAAGRAVTLFADGDGDWAAAFDAKTGKEIWRQRLGERTLGRNGAHDGPLSSPLIGADAVYALAYDGRLVALRLTDGGIMWEKSVEREFGAERPEFGFTTTPLISDGVLVVQAGGAEGKAIVGLNGRTGKTLWTRGDDEVQYQSPALMDLTGRQQVVAFSGKRIVGLAADSGELLWEHPLEENDRANSSLATFIGNDRFGVNVSGDLRVYRVSGSQEGYGVEELYRSNALGRNYVPPVHHDGHLYGFRGQVLTCVNADNGERVWRSREPGGDGLILVDGHLVIFGAKGNVVVAEATPAGYTERARLQALDGSSLTWPSFADGRIFLRNLSELAAVKVTHAASGREMAAAVGHDSAFARWLREVEKSDDRQARVDAYFAEHESLPVVEGEYVHFVYRDPEAGDVGVAGSMNVSGVEPMHHVDGTDLFYRTFRLEPGGRWEYRFQMDFDAWHTDPGNPRTVPRVEGEGEMSELVPAGYESADFLGEPAGPRGKVDELDLTSEGLGYDKKIHVWLPPGYEDGEASYPLLIVNEGDAWRERGLMLHALDNMVGESIKPMVVAFVPPARAWWEEAGGNHTAAYVKMLATELVPELEKRYRLVGSPAGRALMGNRFYGLSAAYAALQYPELFGAVAAQSVYTGLGTRDAVMGLIDAADPQAIRFYIDWNRFDERNIDREWDSGRDCSELHAALEAKGFVVEGGEMLDSYGWGGWRNRLDDMLVMLFPASPGTGG